MPLEKRNLLGGGKDTQFFVKQVSKLPSKIEQLEALVAHFTDWTIQYNHIVPIFNKKLDFELSIEIFFTIDICIVPHFIAVLL